MKPVKEISHIGIAVEKIEKHLSFYEGVLGLKVEKIEVIESEKVKAAFLSVGSARIELLEPLDKESTIRKFIDKRGEGIHHIALEVDDLALRIEKLKKEGIRLINNEPLPGAGDSIRSFIHPQSTGGVLVELTEQTNK